MCDECERLRQELAAALENRDMHRDAYYAEVRERAKLIERTERMFRQLQGALDDAPPRAAGLDDGRRDAVIIALADALLEVSRVDGERVEDCARRLDAESPRHPDQFSITARRMKILALDGAAKVQTAAPALRAHAETITQARVAHHARRPRPASTS